MPTKQGLDRTESGRFRRGASGNPAGRPRRDAVAGRPFAALMPHVDAWMNSTTGLGMSSRDKTLAASFDVDVVTAEDALTIWRGNPMAARIIETVPNECIREGWDFSIGENEVPDRYQPPEIEQPVGAPTTAPKPGAKAAKQDRYDAWRAMMKKHPSAFQRRMRAVVRDQHRRLDAEDAKPLQASITKQMERLQVAPIIRELMHYENAYGGSAGLIGANDYTTDLRQPLDLRKVKSLDYITPLEGRELIPLYYYNDPRAPKFGQPAIYQLVPFTVGAPVDPETYHPRITQIHESRLLVFPGRRVSRRIMSSGTFGWGDSVLTRVIRALRAYDTGNQNAEVLLQDFAQAVYKVKGLADRIALDPNNALMESVMSIEIGRSICRAIVVDSEEEFERKSTSLAGYADLLQMLAQNLAAAAEHPLTILFGTSPAGLNATGASDIRWFYDRVATNQYMRVAPALMRIVEILIATMGEDPEETPHSVLFKPLWQPTEKEVAEAHYTQAQADAVYLDRDVVSPEEIALSRFPDGKFSLETHIDFEARAAQEAVVAPTVSTKPEPVPPALDPNAPPADDVKQPEQRNVTPAATETD
jgi:phage-related protein (TIGR01555 family)